MPMKRRRISINAPNVYEMVRKYLGLKVSDYVRSQNPVTYINC